MFFPKLIVVVLLFTQNVRLTSAFEPVSTVLTMSAITAAGISLLGRPLYCNFFECCDVDGKAMWIKSSYPDLHKSLKRQVYGQHLAVRSISSLLSGHRRYKPESALVLSFHGWTGTGKNHISKIIANNMYQQGIASKYVHSYMGPKHFPRKELTETYKDQIRDWIQGNVSNCPNQLFIFDEVDKMPDGILDVLSPFVDTHDHIGGVDYRQSVFLFLGNAGGKTVFDQTLKHWHEGKKREDLELKDIEKVLYSSLYNERGGLMHSALIQKGVISYVPFLPLEKSHVRDCVKDNLIAKNRTYDDLLIDEVVTQLEFTPPHEKIFSKTGCKRVNQKVNYVLSKRDD